MHLLIRIYPLFKDKKIPPASGNVINLNAGGVTYGITLELSKMTTIEGNDVTLNSEVIYGIEALSSDGNVITGNDFKTDAKQVYGILLSICKENIISNNMNLLSGMLPSFDAQIEKAEKRADFVSVNHRVTEFLASYFDVIFALNEMTHPGEKRMQSICSAECKILPNNFDVNLNKLFANMFGGDVSSVIDEIVQEIQKLCISELQK